LGENFALLGKSTPKQKQNQTITAEDAEKNQKQTKTAEEAEKIYCIPFCT